jgi:ABC-type uncharacterized transport system substrate-binding protein
MLRRSFIGTTGFIIAWERIAIAQQSSNKVWRLGYVSLGNLDNPADRPQYDLFRVELRELGYIEGKNLVVDQRNADGNIERLPSVISELVALRPDVIVAHSTPAVAAAQRATSTIPMIMVAVTDPIGSGFVKSLAQPGGNITGLASMTDDAVGKSVELLHTLLPSAKRIAVLMSNNPMHPRQYKLAEAATKSLGLAAVPVVAPTPGDLEQAFETMKQENCDALFVIADVTRPTIVTLAARSKIPAVYQLGFFVPLGGLASYGPKLETMSIKLAQYVDRIFKGADPAELPVEQPTVFELGVNLKTAASLGLTIPDSVIAQADKVID